VADAHTAENRRHFDETVNRLSAENRDSFGTTIERLRHEILLVAEAMTGDRLEGSTH
jgi:hypothetical protein